MFPVDIICFMLDKQHDCLFHLYQESASHSHFRLFLGKKCLPRNTIRQTHETYVTNTIRTLSSKSQRTALLPTHPKYGYPLKLIPLTVQRWTIIGWNV